MTAAVFQLSWSTRTRGFLSDGRGSRVRVQAVGSLSGRDGTRARGARISRHDGGPCQRQVGRTDTAAGGRAAARDV